MTKSSQPTRGLPLFLSIAAVAALSSCVVPQYSDGRGRHSDSGRVHASTVSVTRDDGGYYHSGQYYTGGRYETGSFHDRGRTYDNRYYHGGRYYYGGQQQHRSSSRTSARQHDQHKSSDRNHDRNNDHDRDWDGDRDRDDDRRSHSNGSRPQWQAPSSGPSITIRP